MANTRPTSEQVRYTPEGEAETTLKDYLDTLSSNASISLKDFGAIGDGITDDTDAVQAAFDFCDNSIATLNVPIGVYLIDSMRTIPNGLKIVGEDKFKSEFKLSADTDGQTKFFFGDALSDFHIENMTVNTDKINNTTARGIFTINFAIGGDNIVFKDIHMPGSTSSGIFCDRSSRVTVDSCYISDCVGDPIRVSNTGADDIRIINNSLVDMDNLSGSSRAIQVGTASNFLVKGNLVKDAVNSFALDFGASTRGVVIGNVIDNCESIVDLEGGCSNITIAGNTFTGPVSGSRSNGIYILENPSTETCSDISITGNTITGYLNGIRCEGGREITISGNHISEMDQSGISIVDGGMSSKLSDNVLITGNSVYNCGLSTPATYDAISYKCDRGVIMGNLVRGGNHLSDIQTNASNTLVHVSMNYAPTITRNESSVYVLMSNRRIYEGSFNPESSVTANPGDLYLRSTGGASTSLYVKETGTSNTGWIGK